MADPSGAAAFHAWDDLLEYIEDRRVVPIIGPELLRQDPASEPLQSVLASRLAGKLGFDPGPIPEVGALNHVICEYMRRRGRREDVYPKIRALMKELPLETPAPLKKLAAISEFRLFVTTTFDSLMEAALDEVRFGGVASTQQVAFSPNGHGDLPAEIRRLPAPMVFHLLGRLSATPDYALTDEDTLEFLCAMQNENRRPQLLLDELRDHHLLFMGCEFSDWLARFFIRITKGGRLSTQRDSREIIADRFTGHDRSLVLFLENFSYNSFVYEQGGAVEFVDRLYEKYQERNGDAGARLARARTASGEPAAPDVLRAGGVFLSYCSEDRAIAERLHAALEAAGLDVWFDRRTLEPGDLYESAIRKSIQACGVFVPVVSHNTELRVEGYFRKEWNWAADRALKFDDSVPFIVPVAVHDLVPDDAMVPDTFRKPHWLHVGPQGPEPDFAQAIVRLVRDRQRRARAV